MLQEKYKPKSWLLTQNEDGTYELKIKTLAINNGEDIDVEFIGHRILIGFNHNDTIIPVPINYEVLKSNDDNSLFHVIISE